MKKLISTYNTLEYHISQMVLQNGASSTNWKRGVQSVIIEKSLKPNSKLNTNLDFDLLAKCFFDELEEEKSKISKNVKIIEEIRKDYKTTKSQSSGNSLFNILFYILILKLCGHKNTYSKVFTKETTNLFRFFNSNNNITKRRFLILDYWINSNEPQEEFEGSNLDELIYRVLYLTIKNKKEKITNSSITEIHLICNKIEEYTLKSQIDEKILLETALILKASLGKGLYIPESKVENYLSSTSKKLVSDKYISILKESLLIKIWKFKIPIYLIPVFILAFEYLVLETNAIAEVEIPFTGIVLTPDFLKEIKPYILYGLNSILFVSFFLIFIRSVTKQINDE